MVRSGKKKRGKLLEMKPNPSISLGRWRPGSRYTNIASTKKYLKRPLETTGSFWDDGFSFNNRTLSSQPSVDNSISPKPKQRKIIKLKRQATEVVGLHSKIHHGFIEMTLNELRDIFKLRYEQRHQAPIDGVIFKLGINENCPEIHCSILGPSNKQVGRLIVKKNVLSQLDFKRIQMAVLREKPSFKIQIGSKMGLRGWNSIKGILKYGEFQFSVDFSAHKNFDRIRLSDPGLKEFMYGIENSNTLK
jgi:hypothetical protein